MKNILPICLLSSALSIPVAAAAAPTLEELRALDQRCEQARQAALAPIREEMKQKCIRERGGTANAEQECAIEVSTYGNSRTGARGNVVPGMFYDLPECKAAKAAWEEREKNPPWR